jgi:hypothetical protein
MSRQGHDQGRENRAASPSFQFGVSREHTLACGTWAKKWANGARNAICKETYFYFYLQAKRLSAVTGGSSHMNGITFL